MQPNVTAIIPCHNHEQWVWDAILSVATQDYPNKNIVVVDNGSTDNSVHNVVSRMYKPRKGSISGIQGEPTCFSGKIPNYSASLLMVSYPKAMGPSFARNRGVEIAVSMGAEIFAFLDSDDMYNAGKISRSVEQFVRYPEVGAVYSDYDTLHPDGLKIRVMKPAFSRDLLLRECIVNCDSLVTRRAIEECDGFDENLRVCEDYDLWLRISEKFMIMHLPESLVTIRVGGHSSTSVVAKELWNASYRRVMQKLRERSS